MLIAIGVGLAAPSMGATYLMAAVHGIFWPATVAYWLLRVLHQLAG